MIRCYFLQGPFGETKLQSLSSRSFSPDKHETKQVNTCFCFCFLIYLFIFIYGCVGSSFLCEGFLQLRQAGATLHRGAWASHYRGLFCGAQAPDAQAQ